MPDGGSSRQTRSLVCLAWATPFVVGVCVLEPRVATNRPSYGFRETMILLTALLAIPCIYAIGRLTRKQSRSAPWPTEAQRWLWSAVATFVGLPLVLSVAGQVAPVSGSYPDDQIPGLTAGLLSVVAATILLVVTLSWMALGRLVAKKAPSTPGQRQET